MDKDNKQLIIILGAPYSGVNLLKNCLGQLGLNNPEESNVRSGSHVGIKQINSSFYESIGFDPNQPGSLPHNWQVSSAAIKTSNDIKKYLTTISNIDGSFVLGDPALCRLMALWLKVITNLNINLNLIHLVRHPWEVASSLHAKCNINIDVGHRLWLKYYQPAYNMCKNKSSLMICYDNLLGDPFLELLRIVNSFELEKSPTFNGCYNEAEIIVNPDSKTFDNLNMSKKDKDLYSPFSSLYNKVYQKSNHIYLDTLKNNAGLIPITKEDELVYSIKEDNDISITDKFNLMFQLANYYKLIKNNLRALHYYKQAEIISNGEINKLLILVKSYMDIGQKLQALNIYIEILFKIKEDNDSLNQNMLELYTKSRTLQAIANEHGHALLIDYINKNIDFIKKKYDRKLRVIEVGSTREDVPGQSSTEKLARFCQYKGLHFITVDMDPRNTKYAKNILDKINPEFEAINQKGEVFLNNYTEPIDFVFLDAYDFDHGKHSEERQSRYEELLGSKINDNACHKMHLDCVKAVEDKISDYGAICLDDSWFESGRWQGKGSTAIPYMIQNGMGIILSDNKAVLMVKDQLETKPLFNKCQQHIKNKLQNANSIIIDSNKDEVLNINGIQLKIDPADKGGLHYNRRQHVEETLSPFHKLLCEWLSPKVIIDVGANYGFTASVFAKEIKPNKLIAIEPDPRLQPYLNDNIKYNVGNDIDVHILPYIVGEKDRADATFGLNPNGSQDNRVYPERGWPICTVTEVTLNMILQKYVKGLPVFIKIDTQGYDPIVIKSGYDYLDSHSNWLIKSEFGPYWIHTQGLDPAESLVELVEKYSVFEAPARVPYNENFSNLFSQPINPQTKEIKNFVSYIENLNINKKGWIDLYIISNSMLTR